MEEDIKKQWEEIEKAWKQLVEFSKQLQEFSVYLSFEQKRELETLREEIRQFKRGIKS